MPEITTAADCERAAERLYAGPMHAAEAVVHIAAIWRRPDGRAFVLAINDATPHSEEDALALGLARARADVIATTGRALRDEPALRHHLHTDPTTNAALARWREESLGRRSPPRTVVLTRGANLPLDHPIFDPAPGGPAPAILTGEDAAMRLADRTRDRAIEVVGRPRPGMRDCLAVARARWGARVIVVEAGPNAASDLYEARIGVDELLLSVYEGESLPERALGPAFIDDARLEAAFGEIRSVTPNARVRAASGVWAFHRFARTRTDRGAG